MLAISRRSTNCPSLKKQQKTKTNKHHASSPAQVFLSTGTLLKNAELNIHRTNCEVATQHALSDNITDPSDQCNQNPLPPIVSSKTRTITPPVNLPLSSLLSENHSSSMCSVYWLSVITTGRGRGGRCCDGGVTGRRRMTMGEVKWGEVRVRDE